MCQSCCLPSTMHGHSLMGLCSLDHPLLVIRTFPTLSLRIFLWLPGPLPRRSLWCSYPFLPTKHRPSPFFQRLGSPRLPCGDFCTGVFSRLQSFSYVLASSFACHPDRSHLYSPAVWQPWRFHLSTVRVVAFPHVRYASRPNRATDGRGLSPPRFAALSAAPENLMRTQ